MSQVEEALASQRQVWREVIQEISKNGVAQYLPPKPPKRIILFGVGSSFFAAKLSAFALIRNAKLDKSQSKIPIIACASVSVGVEVYPSQGDLVLALSHSGKTEATLRALELCEKAGAFTILCAAQGVSPPVTPRLILSTSKIEKCEPHTVGMTSTICAVTLLLMGPVAAPFWDSVSSQPDPKLSELREKMQNPPTLLLGEWEGEWIAREIRLKLIEMANLRPRVFSSEEFFHGPQRILKNSDSSEKIWHVSVPGDLRKDKIPAEYRVEISGDHPLSWVSGLVELQWLVLATALNLGKNPDGDTG